MLLSLLVVSLQSGQSEHLRPLDLPSMSLTAVSLLAMFLLLGAEKGGPSFIDRNFGHRFRLWNVSHLKTSHLIQVGTGEGKSVLLGVLATFLAVSGCDVDCASYQEYLSKRDYESFMHVFDAFGVAQMINYGTFQQLAERSINALTRPDKVRRAVSDLIKGSGSADSGSYAPTPRNKILLIDEVDVFFSKDFYGATYNPSAKFNPDALQALQLFIWEKRAQFGESADLKALCEDVKQQDAFSQLVGEHPHLKSLITAAVPQMVEDCQKVLTGVCKPVADSGPLHRLQATGTCRHHAACSLPDTICGHASARG